MSEKLSELKDKLSSLGISTNTPGLKGKERLEELRNRLEDVLCSEDPTGPSRGGRGEEMQSIARVVENLTSAQIRENLNLLGQNTNTPGLTGEQRREELTRRLIAAVETANMTETFVEELEARSAEPSTRVKPAQQSNGTPSGNTATVVNDHKDKESYLDFDPECVMAQQMYRLAEQRSRMIKMRVEPGPHQESKLKELEDTKLQVLAEIEFIQTKKTKDKFRKESSVLIKDGEPMSVATLLSLLAQKRLEIQEKIQDRKQKIIESENNHPVYGVAVEKDIRDRLIAEAKGPRNMAQLADESMSSLRERVNSVKEKHSYVLKKEVVVEERPSVHESWVRREEKAKVTADHRPVPQLKGPPPEKEPMMGAASTPNMAHSAAVEKDIDREEALDNIVYESNSESSDDDGELPPLLPQPIPPDELSDAKVTSENSPEDTRSPPRSPSDGGSEYCNNEEEDNAHAAVFQRIAPPMAEPPPVVVPSPVAEFPPVDSRDGPGGALKLSRDDSLGELTISADSKRPCAPLSMMSDMPTDSTFKTDFSPTAEMASDKKRDGRHQVKGLDFKGMYVNNAAAAGFKEPPMTNDTEGDDHHDMYGDSDDDEGGAEYMGNVDADVEDISKIKELRLLARKYETEGKLDEAESAYLEALDIDPTDIRTLDRYAIFLHRRRGELPRAAAFFRRAIQECVPSLLRPNPDAKEEKHVPATTLAPMHSSGAFRSKVVTQVLLHYGRFLQRAQGDMDLAEDLFRKAVDVSPDDVGALGALGRFLSSDPIDPRGPMPSLDSEEIRRLKEAEDCFTRALRVEPNNVTILLWYAKLLKSTRKIIQAEIMYSTALKKSGPGTAHAKLEPTAICNYASFLLKYKRDSARAEELFKDGLERYPRHKGLIRNYKHFSKVAAKKRARAPPKVPPDIAQQLAVIENKAWFGDESKNVDRSEAEVAETKIQDSADSEEEQSPPTNGNREDAGGPDDESVISAVTCELDNNKERTTSSSNTRKVNRKSNSELLVELDGVLSIDKMCCAGILECTEGTSAATPLDVTDSNINMTVAVKPGTWKYVKDLNLDSQGVHTSVPDEDLTSNEATAVNLRSSMIVSVHQKSKSDPTRAAMLGFIVLTMTAVLGSPEIDENVYLVERAFGSERFSVDPDTQAEKKVKISGQLKLHIRISIDQDGSGSENM